MDIEKVLTKLDSLDRTLKERFLIEQLKIADEEEDINSRIALLNEMIDFCRDSCQYPKCRIYSNELLTLLEDESPNEARVYADSLLNIANAYRAAKDLEDSLEYYRKALEMYEVMLKPEDFMFAGICNSLALLYQEAGQYEAACEASNKALGILEFHPDKKSQKAITLTNLAQSKLAQKLYDEGILAIEEALKIFEEDGGRDPHYGTALSVYGEILFSKKEYAASAEYYNRAMEAVERYEGESENYEILASNAEEALIRAKEEGQSPVNTVGEGSEEKKQESLTGLQISRMYYEQVGAGMIHEKFARFEARIAVGLVGEGSDCFGFDDEMSRDHDWGPGFCMWVDDVTYEAIGEALESEYEKLPSKFMGMKRLATREAKGRVGVIRIREFYSRVLNLKNGIPRSEEEWMAVKEEDLAAATNGQIFRDDDGVFFSLRNTLLAYYPESVFRKKLSYELIRMAQTGQYNFQRCLKRGDRVTAGMYLAEFYEHTLKTLFLLNRKYAPYKKWMMRSAQKLKTLPRIAVLLSEIAAMDIENEEVAAHIETIASLILNELKRQNLIMIFNKQDPYYLEPYGQEIYNSISYLTEDDTNTVNPETSHHTELVDKLVALEWEALDRTVNEGGRSDCQDDWEDFSIMRKSQYLTWNNELLESYIADFEAANEKGWNLVTEKYARMEESTHPLEYEAISNKLPVIEEERKTKIDEIVKIQVGFMEDFAEDYPGIAKGGRSIHTFEDTSYNTSFETYLRGELMTYSGGTLELYESFIKDYVAREKNLTCEIMSNTAHMRGYAGLEDMERENKN